MLLLGLLTLTIATLFWSVSPVLAHHDAVPTSGVEILARPVSPGVWDITLETDTAIGDGGFNIEGATDFTANASLCNGISLICFVFDSSTGKIVGLAVFSPGALPANLGSPVVLGQATGPVTAINQDEVAGALGIDGFGDLTGARLDFRGEVVPPTPPTPVPTLSHGGAFLLSLLLLAVSRRS